MEAKPDTIHISTMQSEEVQATHADLIVTIKGTSFISGNEALKKSREVNQLVNELVEAGLPVENIRLQGVFTEFSSGNFLKSSSATYRLSVRCDKLEQFPELLGVIFSQKNASLEKIIWRYPDEEMREQLLEKAMTVVQARARKVANNLGIELLGVYTFIETYADEERPFHMPVASMAQAKTRGVGIVPQADLGMDIQHAKKVEVRLDVEYRVSGFTKE